MRRPSAGALRHRINIQSRSSTLDSYGHEINTWTDVLANVPASVEPISGNEKLRAPASASQLSHRVTVRYHSEFSDPASMAAWRIVFGARIFNISSVRILDEKNAWVVIDCIEGSINGQ